MKRAAGPGAAPLEEIPREQATVVEDAPVVETADEDLDQDSPAEVARETGDAR